MQPFPLKGTSGNKKKERNNLESSYLVVEANGPWPTDRMTGRTQGNLISSTLPQTERRKTGPITAILFPFQFLSWLKVTRFERWIYGIFFFVIYSMRTTLLFLFFNVREAWKHHWNSIHLECSWNQWRLFPSPRAQAASFIPPLLQNILFYAYM